MTIYLIYKIINLDCLITMLFSIIKLINLLSSNSVLSAMVCSSPRGHELLPTKN